jgi:hypothetical protein
MMKRSGTAMTGSGGGLIPSNWSTSGKPLSGGDPMDSAAGQSVRNNSPIALAFKAYQNSRKKLSLEDKILSGYFKPRGQLHKFGTNASSEDLDQVSL